eukprot:m.334437 g.334437  ORF g.334437 m.334437 type:complete len:430 (+) comp27756_c0_seq1:220-1509(+)
MVIQIFSGQLELEATLFFFFTRPAQSARQYRSGQSLGPWFRRVWSRGDLSRERCGCVRVHRACTCEQPFTEKWPRAATKKKEVKVLTSRSKCRYGWPRHRHHSPKRPGILCFTDSVARRLPAGPTSNERAHWPSIFRCTSWSSASTSACTRFSLATPLVALGVAVVNDASISALAIVVASRDRLVGAPPLTTRSVEDDSVCSSANAASCGRLVRRDAPFSADAATDATVGAGVSFVTAVPLMDAIDVVPLEAALATAALNETVHAGAVCTETSRGRASRCVGRSSLSAVPSTASTCNVFSLAKVVGTGPCSRFPESASVVSLASDPSASGMTPVRRLFLRLIVFSAGSWPSQSGIEPSNAFFSRLSLSRWTSWSNPAGRWPTSPLSHRLRSVRRTRVKSVCVSGSESPFIALRRWSPAKLGRSLRNASE